MAEAGWRILILFTFIVCDFCTFS